jgi:Tfp pilus assembly protein PilV
MIRTIKSAEGMTLLEVLVGIVILMIIAVPLLSFTITAAKASKTDDQRIAYALLRGEAEIMYKKRIVPSRGLSVDIKGIKYSLSCTTDVHTSN